MKESDWYGINVCVACQQRLNDTRRTYSGGICPKCGYHSSGTICETDTVIAKEIRHHKWWQFWKKEYTYKGKNDFSQKWLDKN